MGTDAYKEMFPNSIWPSTLPSIPPVSIFTLSQNIVNLTPHGQLKTWDFEFPTDVEIIGAGAFGNNISGLYDLAFSPSDGASVGRVFVQFSNLFAWEEEEDENGCHLGKPLGRIAAAFPESANREDRSRRACRTSSPKNRSPNFRRFRRTRSR